MQDPVVSVLMTAYNREKYIAEAIESVLNSDFRDFELIINDDGSRDNTVAIAKEYADKDPRVKVFLNPKNLGDYPNRNQAAVYAKGKYLKYVDADDFIYPWGLSLLVRMMEQFPDAGWGLCSLDQDIKRPFPFQLQPKEAYEYHFLGPGLFYKAPLSAIIKRETFEEAGGFAPIRMAGDFEMWHRLAQRYPVVLMPQGIVWYREHDAQEMNHHSKYIQVYAATTVKYLKAQDCPLEENAVGNIIRSQKKFLYKEMAKGIVTANTPRVKESALQLKLYRNVR